MRIEVVLAALLAFLAVWYALPERTLGRLDVGGKPQADASGRAARIRRRVRSQFSTRAGERRARAIRDGVPTACDLLAVCVEAGRPPRSALLVVANAVSEPTRGVLLATWNEIDLGVVEQRAWQGLGDQPGWGGVARDLARSVDTGIALADLLRAHARSARTEVEAASRERARKVSVSGVVPLMICYLPAFVLVGVVPIFGGLVGRFFGG